MNKTKFEHTAVFETNLQQVVSKLNKKVIRWEESTPYYKSVADGKVYFEIWKWKVGTASELVKRKYPVILSVGYYLDVGCMNWKNCYAANPLKYVGMSRKEANNPLTYGLETCAWEMNEQDLNSENMWMRVIAISEQMWSSSRETFLLQDRTTYKRITRFCYIMANLDLFPKEMCLDDANQFRKPLAQTEHMQQRGAERDAMLCSRASTKYRCTTSLCEKYPEYANGTTPNKE